MIFAIKSAWTSCRATRSSAPHWSWFTSIATRRCPKGAWMSTRNWWNLMLGFWETHREGVADVRELALMDGTGRTFMEEKEAVEAKERALIDLADWMQLSKAAEVEKEIALEHLAAFFARSGRSRTRRVPQPGPKAFLMSPTSAAACSSRSIPILTPFHTKIFASTWRPRLLSTAPIKRW